MNILNKLPKPFFVLAPMDDVTDTVFRRIIAECAPPDLYFTEFVNVDGLQSPGRPRLMHKLQFTPKEMPLIAQIWGLKPDNYRKTTKELRAMGFAGVDINMGCPIRTVVKNGACSALINNRELTEEIISAVSEGAGAPNNDFPVSVKTRLGVKSVDLSWIEFLLAQKLNMLTIHLRTAKEMSKAPAHWEMVPEIMALRDSLSPSTLIVGNGDVNSRQQGLELANKYNLDGIMVGRGVFDDPFMFADKSPWIDYSKEGKIALYTKQVKLFAKTWPDADRKVRSLNKFCKVYIEGFPGAKELREKLMAASSTNELLKILSQE